MAARAALTPEQRAEQRRQHGKQFLDDIARFVKPERLEVFQQLREDLEGEDAVSFISDTVLRRQEGSRLTNAVIEQQRELETRRRIYDQWWADNEQAARIGTHVLEQNLWDAEHGTLRTPVRAANPTDDPDDLNADGTRPAAAASTATPPRRPDMPPRNQPTYVTREELSQLEQDSIQLQSDLTRIGLNHLTEFKESLDTNDLIEFARANRVPLTTAYDAYVKDRRDARVKAEHDEAIKRAREEGRQEALRTSQPGPYPPPSHANPVLSQINQPVNANEYGVSAAVAEYETLRRGNS